MESAKLAKIESFEALLIGTGGSKMAESTVAEGITTEIKGDTLTITCKLKDRGASASGKSHVYASTRGNIRLPDSDFHMGLTVYKKV